MQQQLPTKELRWAGVQIMDSFSASSLIPGLVSGVVSSVLTYFGTRSKIRLEMRVEYDKALHDKRLELYRELWPETEAVARFKPHFVLTYSIVKAVAEKTREWYFRKEGGIYLSKPSRKPYFRLKEIMQRVIDNTEMEKQPDATIDDNVRDDIVRAASRLRASLADDIGTRRAPWL
jgi:hypothetical protein